MYIFLYGSFFFLSWLARSWRPLRNVLSCIVNSIGRHRWLAASRRPNLQCVHSMYPASLHRCPHVTNFILIRQDTVKRLFTCMPLRANICLTSLRRQVRYLFGVTSSLQSKKDILTFQVSTAHAPTRKSRSRGGLPWVLNIYLGYNA